MRFTIAVGIGAVRAPGETRWGLVVALVLARLSVFLVAVSFDDVSVGGAAQFARAGYCSVPGNTSEAGAPLQPSTFLDLVVGEPEKDAHYAGATPAAYVEGLGLTCSPPPAGYVRHGFASGAGQVGTGIYPYYAPAGD